MMTNRMRGVLVSLGLLLATGPLALMLGCSGSSSSTPPAPTVSSITAAPSSMALLVGATAQITLTATYSDSTTATVTALATSYASSSATVATVSAGGLVTAVAPGTTTITATYSGKTSTVAVTVAPTLSSITVGSATSALVVGGTSQIAVTAHYSDNSTATVTGSATYVSGTPTVATVSTGGLITAVSAGTATITATYQTKTATVAVTVTPVVTLSSITVAPTTMALNPAGTSQIVVTSHMSDSGTANVTSGTTFSSSATGVATVSTGGLVTAVAAGSATITATYQTKTATLTVTVSALPVVKYLYSTASSTADITATWGEWGTGTAQTIFTGDATYNPCLKLVNGSGWGPAFCQAWSALDQGKLSEFTTLKFKIKTSDYAAVSVKVPSTGSNEELSYALSTGTALSGGWVQMSIPLSDFLTNSVGATEFAIFGFGAGTVYLTDIGLTGTGAVNKTGLAAAVTAAQANLAAHTVGTGDGNVTQATHDAYNTAIITANAVATGSPTVQSTVTAAWVALNAATATFNAAILHPLPTTPTTAPTAPSLAAANVMSLLSKAYTNMAVDTWGTTWSNNNAGANLTEVVIAGDPMKKYTGLIYIGIEFTGANMINATGMTHFHLDVWTPDIDTLKVKLVDFGANAAWSGGDDTEFEIPFNATSTPALTGKSQWVSLDIPLASFTGMNRAHLAQLILSSGAGTGTLFIDNVYFHK